MLDRRDIVPAGRDTVPRNPAQMIVGQDRPGSFRHSYSLTPRIGRDWQRSGGRQLDRKRRSRLIWPAASAIMRQPKWGVGNRPLSMRCVLLWSTTYSRTKNLSYYDHIHTSRPEGFLLLPPLIRCSAPAAQMISAKDARASYTDQNREDVSEVRFRSSSEERAWGEDFSTPLDSAIPGSCKRTPQNPFGPKAAKAEPGLGLAGDYLGLAPETIPRENISFGLLHSKIYALQGSYSGCVRTHPGHKAGGHRSPEM
jgi:hypothetical protein